jgi:hypothetical protein
VIFDADTMKIKRFDFEVVKIERAVHEPIVKEELDIAYKVCLSPTSSPLLPGQMPLTPSLCEGPVRAVAGVERGNERQSWEREQREGGRMCVCVYLCV